MKEMDKIISWWFGAWASTLHTLGSLCNQFSKEEDKYDVKKPKHWNHWGGQDDK